MEATISCYQRKRKKKNNVTTVGGKDWSGLHQDLIRCFARQIVSMKDFFAFGGVSKSWRSEAIKENSNKGLRLQHKVPVLLLSKEINDPIRNIYSLTKGLAIYKPGYNNGAWTRIPQCHPLALLMDAIYYKGQFYAVDYDCEVFVCEIEDPNNAHMRLVAPEIPKEQLEIRLKAPYLVETATGTLLLVLSLFKEYCEVSTGCRVFELQFDDIPFISWAKSEIKNLGNRTLFLGANNSSFSIEACDDSISKTNGIYFLNRSHVSDADDIDIFIYYMEDGKIDRHLETLPDFHYRGSWLTSHSWLQPSF